MATINVAKAFTLTRDDGTKAHFPAGVHADVDDKDAGHWFTRAHLAADPTGLKPVSAIPHSDAGNLNLIKEHEALRGDYARLAKEHDELQVEHGLVVEDRDKLADKVKGLELRLDEAKVRLAEKELGKASEAAKPAVPAAASKK